MPILSPGIAENHSPVAGGPTRGGMIGKSLPGVNALAPGPEG